MRSTPAPAVRWQDVALALARVGLGALFIYAALTKLPDMTAFAEEVADYQVLPARLVPLLTAALPGIEVVAGLLLVVGAWVRPAAGVLTALLLVFIAALAQSLLRGIDLRCGCFGGADLATWGTVWRDVALLVPAVAVLACGGGRLTLQRLLAR